MHGSRLLLHRLRPLLLHLALISSLSLAAAAFAQPGSTVIPPQGMQLEQEKVIAGYRVERWQSVDQFSEGRVRIFPPEGPMVELVNAVFNLMAMPEDPYGEGLFLYRLGDDLTGNGVPDLFIEGYSMGAHCCFEYHLFELGAEGLKLLWHGFTADAGAVLKDLDGDGEAEIITADMSYAYQFCSFASSPAPLVVLDQVGEQYMVANVNFPRAYDREIVWGLQRALSIDPRFVPDDGHACQVADLVLSLLYSGDEAAALLALERFYLLPDRDAFHEALWTMAQASPLFQTALKGP